MQSVPTTQPYRCLILNSHGWVTKFRFFLPYLTENVNQAFHEIMYVVIESIRYRNRAMREIVAMVKNLETNIDVWVTCKAEIVSTLKQMAMELYFEAEALGLYNDDDVLMYTYAPHPEPTFEDVILNPVIPLTYNPSVPCYEPRPY